MASQQYPLPYANEGDDVRLNLQHQIFRETLEGRLLNTPLTNPAARVLEIGAGSGVWAVEFANEHPAAEVVGIDLFEPPTAPPSNCKFLLRDAEKDWDIGSSQFDVVHTRMVLFHVKDVAGILRKAFEHLKPGGFIEIQEMWLPYQTDEPPGAPEHTSQVILSARLRGAAAAKRGVNQSIAGVLPEMLPNAGFTDVQVRDEKWPIGPWMEDEKMKSIGEKFSRSLAIGLMGFSKSLMTSELGMSESQVVSNVQETIAVLGKGKIYAPMRFISARKPE